MGKLLNNLEEGGGELSHIHLVYLLIPAQSHGWGGGDYPCMHKLQGSRSPVHHRINIRQMLLYRQFNLLVHLICRSLDCGGKTRAGNGKTVTRGSGRMIQDLLALTDKARALTTRPLCSP